MRLATYEHLIAAETLADAAAGALDAAERLDLDMDGFDEVRLADAGQVVTIDLNEGGGIGGWDIRAAQHAVNAVMRRRPEAYHETLRAHEAKLAEAVHAVAAVTAGDGGGASSAPASIHDAVRVKEAGLADRLRYDDHERRSALVRFLRQDISPDGWAAAASADLGDALDRSYDVVELGPRRLTIQRDAAVAGGRIQVTKSFQLGGGRLDPTLEVHIAVENLGPNGLETRLGIESTTTMLGGGGNPSAWWEVSGTRTLHDGSGCAAGVRTLSQGNAYIGVEIATGISIPADAWWAPVETISNSENGFERVYQGSGMLLSWPLSLEPGARWDVRISNAVTVTRDHMAEA